MADFKISAESGKAIAREKLIAYLNTGTSASPIWTPMGKRTTSSSIDMDWGDEDYKDILGNTFSTMKKPTLTQTFDPWDLEGGEAAQEKIVNLAIIQQDAQALTNMDMMIAHYYLASDDSVAASFAERYSACKVKPTSLGGDGGGNLGMPTEVTYGGTRTVGTVTVANGVASFVPDT